MPTAKTNSPQIEANRDVALVDLNVPWFMSILSMTPANCSDQNQLLVMVHKSRYDSPNVPANLRAESRKWLKDNDKEKDVDLVGKP